MPASFRSLLLGSFLLALTPLAPAAPTLGASEPVAWRFAHPEAQVLAGVDFRMLAASPDGQQLRAQFAAALGAPLLAQAERLLLSSVMDSSGRRADVLVLSGSFTLAELRKLAMREGARMIPYKGLEIAAPPGAAAADPHLAWVTGPGAGTTVLIGTRPGIQAAAERARAHVESLASVNPLFARARELAPRYAVWVSCETVPGGVGPKSLDPLVEGGESGQVNGFDLALDLAAAPALSVWFRADTEAAAELALRHLQAGVAARESFLLAPWLAELKGTLEESTLALGAPLAPGAVATRVGSLLAAFALPLDARPAPAASAHPAVAVRAKVDASVPMTGVAPLTGQTAAPAQPPAPPKKLVVRIEGLDDGPKEVPYQSRQ